MADRAKQIFRLYTGLNLLAGLVWVLFVFETIPRTASPVSDYGVPVGLAFLFFALPLAAGAIHLLGRRSKEPLTTSRKAYYAFSKFFLAVSWLASCLPMLFWAGILLEALSGVWPFSMREGPDTAFAQRCFEKHFGFPPPASVQELYCAQRWEFGDGNTYRGKFRFTEAAVAERIARTLALERLSAGETQSSWIRESSPPAWWPGPRSVRFQQAYRRGTSPARLWIDREDRTVYYRSWP